MAEDNIILPVDLDTRSALKNLSSFRSNAESAFSSITKSVGLMKTAFIAAAGYFALDEAISSLTQFAEAAAEEEAALNSLNVALAANGNYTEDASQSMLDFAATIQKTTAVEDGAVISTAALIENLTGLEKDGLQRATKAAINLSQALGKDLETTATAISKAMEGNVTALKKFGIGVQKGASDAQTFDNALKLIEDRFGGAAASKLNTYAGATAQLGNVYGDLQESIGNIIIKNPVLIKALGHISNAIQNLTEFVINNSDMFGSWLSSAIVFGAKLSTFMTAVVSGILSLMKYMAVGVQSIFDEVANYIARQVNFAVEVANKFGANLKPIFKGTADSAGETARAYDKIIGKVDDFGVGLAAVADDLQSVQKSGKKVTTTIVNGSKRSVKATEDLSKAVQELEGKIKDQAKANEALAKENEKRGKTFIELADLEYNSAVDTAMALELEAEKLGKLDSKTQDIIDTTMRLAEAKRQAVKAGVGIADIQVGDIQSVFEQGIGPVFKNQLEIMRTKFKTMTLGDLAAGLYDAASKIFGAVSSGIESMLEGAFWLLSGQFLKDMNDLVSTIGNMPKQVLEFVKGLDSTIKNLLKTLPEVFDRLFRNLDTIVERIAQGLQKLVTMLVDNLPKLAESIARVAPKLGQAILDAIPRLIKAAPKILIPLIKLIPIAVKQIMLALPDIITALADAIPQILKVLLGPVLVDVITTIIDNIPIIAETLIVALSEGSDELAIGLIDSFIFKGGLEKLAVALVLLQPRIAAALIDGMWIAAKNGADRWGGAVADWFKIALSQIGPQIGTKISEGFKNAFDGSVIDKIKAAVGGGLSGASMAFGTQAANVFRSIIRNIELPTLNISADKIKLPTLSVKTPGWLDDLKIPTPSWLKRFEEAVNKLGGAFGGGGGGGGGGGAGGILNPANWATGGIVPRGFPNDSFSANLTSGEMVVPAKTTDELFSMISDLAAGGGSRQTGPIQINLQIGEKELANVLLDLNRRGYRTA